MSNYCEHVTHHIKMTHCKYCGKESGADETCTSCFILHARMLARRVQEAESLAWGDVQAHHLSKESQIKISKSFHVGMERIHDERMARKESR